MLLKNLELNGTSRMLVVGLGGPCLVAPTSHYWAPLLLCSGTQRGGMSGKGRRRQAASALCRPRLACALPAASD